MLFVSGYINKINLVETELLKDKFLLLSFTLKHITLKCAIVNLLVFKNTIYQNSSICKMKIMSLNFLFSLFYFTYLINFFSYTITKNTISLKLKMISNYGKRQILYDIPKFSTPHITRISLKYKYWCKEIYFNSPKVKIE